MSRIFKPRRGDIVEPGGVSPGKNVGRARLHSPVGATSTRGPSREMSPLRGYGYLCSLPLTSPGLAPGATNVSPRWGLRGEPVERPVIDPVDRPLVQRHGPQGTVEADRRRVPVEHRPFDP